MRTPLALISALAYALGRSDSPTDQPAPAIVEPWRSPGIPDEPDPIAQFILEALRPCAGGEITVAEVLDNFDRWTLARGRTRVPQSIARGRLPYYVTVCAGPLGAVVTGYAQHPYSLTQPAKQAARALDQLRPTTPALRSIPALRARVQADAGLLCAELLNTLQATREVLDPITDEPGQLGDVVRIATGMLDDAFADAAAAPSL